VGFGQGRVHQALKKRELVTPFWAYCRSRLEEKEFEKTEKSSKSVAATRESTWGSGRGPTGHEEKNGLRRTRRHCQGTKQAGIGAAWEEEEAE